MNAKMWLVGISVCAGIAVGVVMLAKPSSQNEELATLLEERLIARFERIEKTQEEWMQRLSAIEQTLESRASAAALAAAAAPRTLDSALAPTPAEIVQRLEKIEQQRAAQPQPASAVAPIQIQPAELGALTAANRSKATDASLSVKERVAALSLLRGVKDGRSREVVLSMVDLVRSSQDHKVRRDIIRNLHHANEPELKFLLLDIINNPNDDEGVRQKSAEDIDTFLDDPAVHAALLHVAQNDKSSKVKSAAYEALAEWEEDKKKKK